MANCRYKNGQIIERHRHPRTTLGVEKVLMKVSSALIALFALANVNASFLSSMENDQAPSIISEETPTFSPMTVDQAQIAEQEAPIAKQETDLTLSEEAPTQTASLEPKPSSTIKSNAAQPGWFWNTFDYFWSSDSKGSKEPTTKENEIGTATELILRFQEPEESKIETAADRIRSLQIRDDRPNPPPKNRESGRSRPIEPKQSNYTKNRVKKPVDFNIKRPRGDRRKNRVSYAK